MEKIFDGIWREGRKLFTKNFAPGKRVYGEELVKKSKDEFRSWDHTRSKAAAAIAKGLQNFPIKEGQKILYLGSSSGTTVSHVSDIIGKDGVIYAVEISERSMRDLNVLVNVRENIVPILANAKTPEEYSWVEPCDIVYQDVATEDQSEILIRNCQKFLKKTGFALLAIKSRSIDVTKEPKDVYKQEIEKLKQVFEIVEKKELDPFEKDHMFVVLRFK